jgi:hypothetical protein
MKKRQMAGPVEDHIEEIKKAVFEIFGEHKEIIIFLPDDESLDKLPADFSYDEENIRNFIRNHVYSGDINTIQFMKPNSKISLKSLNGTELNVEMKRKIMTVNGMQITDLYDDNLLEMDGSKANIYTIRGFILPGFKPSDFKKYREPFKGYYIKNEEHGQAFRKYYEEELKKGNPNARDKERAFVRAMKRADKEIRNKKK